MDYKQLENIYKYGDKTSGSWSGVVNDLVSVKLGEKTRLFKMEDGLKRTIYGISVDNKPFLEVYYNNKQKIITPFIESKMTLIRLNMFSKFTVTRHRTGKLKIHLDDKVYEVEEGLLL